MQSVRSAAPLIASLLLLVFGIPLVLAGGLYLLPGLALSAAGGAGLVYFGVRVAQEQRDRADPYDLSRLWDKPPPDPEEPEHMADADALAYCHRCVSSMPRNLGICPECGNRLGM